MRTLWGLVILLLWAWPGLAAETNEFLVRSHTNSAGQVLLYRLLLPKNYDPTIAYPEILYLHGAAARGNDNAEPLNWGPLLFLDPALRDKYPFFLVVPQCPSNNGWSDVDGRSLKESEPLLHSIELLKRVLPAQYKIDEKRRYITGVSMGGNAVWITMIRHPGFFAAAVPVCSGGIPRMVTAAAARYPLWVFHSDDDHIIPVQSARDMVKAWRDHGGTAKYTEYTGLKHSSWKKAYTELEMYDWLLRQTLK
jgi:predicted peptidase